MRHNAQCQTKRREAADVLYPLEQPPRQIRQFIRFALDDQNSKRREA